MKNLAFVLALVLISLPAMGQDKKPVKKPSGEAVKKAAQQPDLEALGAKLKVAVDAGKLTEKEAKAIYAKTVAGQGKSKDGAKPKAIAKPGAKPGAKPIKVDLDALGAKLKAAVDAGKLTEKEAIAIYEKAEAGQGKSKEGLKSEKGDLAEAYEKVAWEIQAAIKAGKITPEQGKEKLAAFKKQLGAKVPAKEAVKKSVATKPDLFELFHLVEKGELTAKEAMEKYKAARAKKEIPSKKELPGKK